MWGRRRADREADSTALAPTAAPPAGARPEPPAGARHLVVVVFDSLRWDSAIEAGMDGLARLGPVERRWSYASWTAPSHFNLLMGLLPHRSPKQVYASEYYKEDFSRYTERLGVAGMEFKQLLPSLYLPLYLRDTLGYETRAFVSMPVLNRFNPVNTGFSAWELMPRHNDMQAMVERLDFSGDRPTFHLLNVGETHYPYATPDEDPAEWPRISGVHGVFKHLDEQVVGGRLVRKEPAGFFGEEQMRILRDRQIRAARHCDRVLEQIYDLVPPETWIIATSDHGELFGEEGYFGHGPVAHEKVYEVPFAEGMIR